jgi:hypothetical protein
MALHAARRLSSTSSTSSATAPLKLSAIFRDPRPRPRPTHLSPVLLGRKPRSPRPGSDDEPPSRRPRPETRQPWEEEAGALLRRLHEGRYLPGPDLSSAPRAASPAVVKSAAERFGHDNQVVAK